MIKHDKNGGLPGSSQVWYGGHCGWSRWNGRGYWTRASAGLTMRLRAAPRTNTLLRALQAYKQRFTSTMISSNLTFNLDFLLYTIGHVSGLLLVKRVNSKLISIYLNYLTVWIYNTSVFFPKQFVVDNVEQFVDGIVWLRSGEYPERQKKERSSITIRSCPSTSLQIVIIMSNETMIFLTDLMEKVSEKVHSTSNLFIFT